jgi:hypothetical protein
MRSASAGSAEGLDTARPAWGRRGVAVWGRLELLYQVVLGVELLLELALLRQQFAAKLVELTHVATHSVDDEIISSRLRALVASLVIRSEAPPR